MLGGVVELIEAARDRLLARRAVARWHEVELAWDSAEAAGCQEAVRVVADEALTSARGGQFVQALVVSGDLAVQEEIFRRIVSDVLFLDRFGPWLAFRTVLRFAADLDAFLASLEGDRRTAALAGDCRGEMELLRVLADLCEDAGLPRAAEEARRLHELAVGLVRNPPLD